MSRFVLRGASLHNCAYGRNATKEDRIHRKDDGPAKEPAAAHAGYLLWLSTASTECGTPSLPWAEVTEVILLRYQESRTAPESTDSLTLADAWSGCGQDLVAGYARFGWISG